jgi:hypothetical protein
MKGFQLYYVSDAKTGGGINYEGLDNSVGEVYVFLLVFNFVLQCSPLMVQREHLIVLSWACWGFPHSRTIVASFGVSD